MKHTLEGSRLFPYIAWLLVIIFAVFTYVIAQKLQYTEQEYSSHKTRTLDALNKGEFSNDPL